MDNYNDIINMPHYTSSKHKRMSLEARSAQFAPFAALKGFEEAVFETARLTDDKKELDEGLKNLLNEKLKVIQSELENKIEITFTYFIKDKYKDGGKYITKTGIVKKIDEIEGKVILDNHDEIIIDDIIEIEGNNLNNFNS